jgi:hypothetical protein
MSSKFPPTNVDHKSAATGRRKAEPRHEPTSSGKSAVAGGSGVSAGFGDPPSSETAAS